MFEFQAKTAGNVPQCNVSFQAGSTASSSGSTSTTTTGSAGSTTTTQTPAPTAVTTMTTAASPTTTTSTSSAGTYNYEVLHKSILFYEAQRSGELPANNRISWRGNSSLGDRGNNGEDLTGGWYDAGDYVKLNSPQSSSVTLLVWEILSFWEGYEEANEIENVIDSIKWPLDYFLKCHVAPNKFYARVGDGHIDHSYWMRAEDMPRSILRPAFFISAEKPGSDLASEVASAMAGCILFGI